MLSSAKMSWNVTDRVGAARRAHPENTASSASKAHATLRRFTRRNSSMPNDHTINVRSLCTKVTSVDYRMGNKEQAVLGKLRGPKGSGSTLSKGCNHQNCLDLIAGGGRSLKPGGAGQGRALGHPARAASKCHTRRGWPERAPNARAGLRDSRTSRW